MRNTRIGVVGAIVAVLALFASACGDSGDDTTTAADGDETTTTAAADEGSESESESGSGGGSSGGPTCSEGAAEGDLTVGSTDFSEQTIVAEMYVQCLEAAGVSVDSKLSIGSREIVLPALESGDIDLYPEYVGTVLTFLGGTPTPDLDESVTALRPLFEEKGITVLEPSPAEDKNGFAVTEETAEEYDLTTLSDLEPVAGELTFGAGPECPERPLCLLGLQETYGLEFANVERLDSGGPLTKDALENGAIDVGLVFTSDGAVPARGFVILEDDKGLQPVENIVPVIRDDALNPEIEALLDEISAALTTEELSELNKLVDVDKEDPSDAATTWLEENGFL